MQNYLYYYSQTRPDWPAVLEKKAGKLYSIIILDNSTGLSASRIKSFNYDKLLDDFDNPIELRKFDYREYPIFGFLFTESSADNQAELENILTSDLTQYIEGA